MCCPCAAYNTPALYQLGWNTPTQLNGQSLTLGATVTLTTTAMTRSSIHGIRISPDWCDPRGAPGLGHSHSDPVLHFCSISWL